jgi:spore coat protein CotH
LILSFLREKIMRCWAVGLVVATVTAVCQPSPGQVPSYAALYDPLQVLNLNLEMDPADWAAVEADTNYTIHKPAYFYADGENKIVVDVRRKPTLATGDKVSLKIDVNSYFDSLQWHGVKKLSLENGNGACIVKEGLAWYLHRQATALDTSYEPPLASWVNVNVNGQRLGVYTNVEQPDKTFLRNRDLWVANDTWLYKQGDIGPPELDSGSGTSSTFKALNYKPFNGSASPPAGYEAQLQTFIDMPQMLTVGAVNAFTGNMDELLTKGKNFFFADFSAGASGGKRLYFPWDLDSVFSGNVSSSIYLNKQGKYSDFQQYITNNSAFHTQYNQLMLELLETPLSSTQDFLNELEPILTPSLLADPYSEIGTTPSEIAGEFSSIRQWLTNREANVRAQVLAYPASVVAAETQGQLVPEPSTVAMFVVFLGCLLMGLRVRSARRIR